MKTRSLIFALTAWLVVLGVGSLSYQAISFYIIIALSLVVAICVFYAYEKHQEKLADTLYALQSINKRNGKDAKPDWRNIKEEIKNIEQTISKTANTIQSLTTDNQAEILIDSQENDPVFMAIKEVKEKLAVIREKDKEREWLNAGLAKFTELLREKQSMGDYTQKILSSLIKYIDANQGGFYVYDESKKSLKLTACYAYDKKRVVENEIEIGQGLLGQNILERDFVFLTDIPSHYVKITSGLGLATPKNIIIVPLIFNDGYYGAMEIALFHILKPHQIEFLKKLSETIASEIAAIKSLENTQHLLSESEILAKELQSREEEMRQNIEELAATQEEMNRKQTELAAMIHAIDATLGTIEFNDEGLLLSCNSIVEEIFQTEKSILSQMPIATLFGKQLNHQWKDIKQGICRSLDIETKNFKQDQLWLSTTFTIMHDNNGKVWKVLCMLQDITEKKQKELEFQRLSLVANNTDNSVIITDANGITEYVNQGFVRVSGFSPEEIIGKKPGHLLQGPLTDKNTIAKLSKCLKEKRPVYEEILNYNKKGETYWISLAINPVRDKTGEVVNYISIQADITETKKKALDFHQKMEAIGKANAILEVSPDGKIIELNDNYANLLGYKREQLLGKQYDQLITDEKIKSEINFTEEKKSDDLICTRINSDGEVVKLKLQRYPVLDINGKIKKTIEFATDITTEVKLAKEAEVKQVELNGYMDAINNTIASVEFNPMGDYIFANDIYLKVMGYKHNEIEGSNFTKLMGEDPTTLMMWENLKLGKFFAGEFKMIDKLNKELWLVGPLNPIKKLNGDIDKIVMLAQFITQEKEKLNELQTTAQAIKLSLPIVEFNKDFTCKSANELFMKLAGVGRLELKNKSLNDFIDPAWHSVWAMQAGQILNNDFHKIEIPFQWQSGIAHYEVSLSIIRSLAGEVSRITMLLIRKVEKPESVLAAV